MSLPTFRQIPASAPVVPRISVFQPIQQPNSRLDFTSDNFNLSQKTLQKT